LGLAVNGFCAKAGCSMKTIQTTQMENKKKTILMTLT